MLKSMTDYQSELREIYKTHKFLTPESVLEAARDPDTALHDQFEWDNEVAGHKWRLNQARHLIIDMQTTVKTSEGRELTVREFVNIKHEEGSNKGIYISFVDAREDPNPWRQVMEAVVKDLESVNRKYEAYSELGFILEPLAAILDAGRSKLQQSA
jgi:hypothetical protein